MAKVEDVKELIEEIGDQSIVPDPPPQVDTTGEGTPLPRRSLDSLFTTRTLPRLGGDRVAAWWSPQRDIFLWRTVFGSDIASSSIFSTCARLVSTPISVIPKDKANRNNRNVAIWSEMLLQYYWAEEMFKFALDWQTQDNGAFCEIMGAGDPGGPIEPTLIPGTGQYIYGTGLRTLDAQNCTRTGDPEYPVVYRHRDRDSVVRYYKFHHTRIMFSSQMPSTRQGMYDVGFCGASRAIHNILRLDDLRIFEDETIGVRPATQLVFGKGLSAKDMEEAFIVAETKAGNDVKSRAAFLVFMGIQGNPEIIKASDLKIMDLKKYPEGYNPEMNMNICMNVMAMALGFDSREFWPATVRGATRADAEVQDRKANNKTHGIWRNTLTNQLNRKWCGAMSCQASFDKKDDQDDALVAEIVKTRSESRASDLTANILDRVIVWQQMLNDGEINEDQYNYLLAQKAKMEAEQARQNVQNQQGGQQDGKPDGASGGGGGSAATGDQPKPSGNPK